MQLSHQRLKHARKSLGLSLSQMAYLMGINVSNLSKHEKGKRTIPKNVMIGYGAITGNSWKKLFPEKVKGVVDAISERTYELLEELEVYRKSDYKVEKTIKILNNVVKNLACLQVEVDHDEK